MKRNVNDWERIASLVAGSLLLWNAARRPRANRAGATITAAGLIGRRVSGYCPVNHALGRERRRDDTKQALGGDNGIFLRERVTVQASPDRLYRFWQQPAN